MTRPPTALVIFDCDGVLVDSEPIALRMLVEMLAEAGVPLDAAAVSDRFLGRSLASTRAHLAEEFGLTLTDATLEDLRLKLYAAFGAELAPIPGVAETLARLGTPFCVASSSQTERIRLSLDLTGLLPAFEGAIFSASEVANGKPAPDLFLHAAARMGADPAACLVVEDSPAGVAAGKAAGMRVVGFLGGGHAGAPSHRAALALLAPDAMISDMRDLPELL
jgi:HAD superfamily hydrolase (TIGR01509 family)